MNPIDDDEETMLSIERWIQTIVHWQMNSIIALIGRKQIIQVGQERESMKQCGERGFTLQYLFQSMIISMLLMMMENFFSSCGQTNFSWLFLHLCFVWLFSLSFVVPFILPLAYFVQNLWMSYRCDRTLAEDFSFYMWTYSRFGRFRFYVLYEIRLIFIYVCTAYGLTRLMNDRFIHWMTIFRWSVEASLIPFTFVTILTVYFEVRTVYLYEVDLTLISPVIYTIKGASCLFLRYAEWYSHSMFNDRQILILHRFCPDLNLDHLIDNCHLKRFAIFLKSFPQWWIEQWMWSDQMISSEDKRRFYLEIEYSLKKSFLRLNCCCWPVPRFSSSFVFLHDRGDDWSRIRQVGEDVRLFVRERMMVPQKNQIPSFMRKKEKFAPLCRIYRSNFFMNDT